MFLNGLFSNWLTPPIGDVPRLIPKARESGFVQSFDGTRIYFELHGPHPRNSKNDPLVFCYGLACSMNQWRAQIQHFSKSHPCVLLDYRGHHRSEYPDEQRAMNLSALAKDAAAVMKYVIPEGKKSVIWGHSMGANVALELAMAEPELCKCLVLACGSAENPLGRLLHSNFFERYLQPLLSLFPENKAAFYSFWRLLLARPELSRKVVLFAGFNRGAIKSEDVDTYIKAVEAVEPKTVFPLLIEMTRGDTQNILPRINCPTLVVAGGDDHVTPPAAQRSLARDLPKAQYFEIPTGSHNVQLDFGEYVCLKAEEFWESL